MSSVASSPPEAWDYNSINNTTNNNTNTNTATTANNNTNINNDNTHTNSHTSSNICRLRHWIIVTSLLLLFLFEAQHETSIKACSFISPTSSSPYQQPAWAWYTHFLRPLRRGMIITLNGCYHYYYA